MEWNSRHGKNGTGLRGSTNTRGQQQEKERTRQSYASGRGKNEERA